MVLACLLLFLSECYGQAAQRPVVISNGAEPISLDPHKTTSAVDFRIHRDLFEGLVVHDDDGGIIPGQAESWQVSDDARTFTFFLRKNARWSNGEPVTAHDFVYSWQRLVNPDTASPYAWYLEAAMVEQAAEIIRGKAPAEKLGVKAIDDHTFEVKLSQPLPYFLFMLTMMNVAPLHRDTVKRWGKDWTQPEHMVGNGAYTLKSWVVNEKVEVVRNPHYWNDKKTNIDHVIFVPVESTAELNRYKAGDVHLTNAVPAEHFRQLAKEKPGELQVHSALGTIFISLNTHADVMSDVQVRRALSYALDRRVLAEKVAALGSMPAYSLTPPAVYGFHLPDIDYQQQSMEKRLQKSREWLKAAGYHSASPLNVELVFQAREDYRKLAVAVSQMWKKIGVHTQLVSAEVGGYKHRVNSGAYQAAISIWLADYNEASTMLNIMTTGHSNNYSRYKSPEFDRLLASSRLLLNEHGRNQVYGEAEQILARDMPIIPLYHTGKTFLMSPDLGGYPVRNPKGTVYSRNLYWKSDAQKSQAVY